MTDKKLDNISGLEAKFNMKIEEGGSFDYPVSGDKTIRVFSENTKVNVPAIIEGNALSGDDILVDPAYAKANNLKPYNYFEFLLTEIPKHMEDTNLDFLDDFLPWSEKLPSECKKQN
jgi:hypothetical protein